MRLRLSTLLLSVALSATLATAWVHAQAPEEHAAPGGADEASAHEALAAPMELPVLPGAEGRPAELAAWNEFALGNRVRARELAEQVIAADPSSYLGHFVLGLAQHYGEANLPTALFHETRALELYEAKHGVQPGPDRPWRWHARILRELAITRGDLGEHDARLATIARYNEIYDPDILAERAWTLMKMGQFERARAVARASLASDDSGEVEIALNALCAIEYEGGGPGAGYVACREALEWARRDGRTPSAVDLTNFAEGARSLFQLDECERALLEATRIAGVGFGNPWLELAELYSREARHAEAHDALRKIPPYRMRRPPHLRDADRNEAWRAQATFLLTVGRPADALRITERAMVMPDRRAHNSRDPAQDRAVIALLDRRARRMLAETEREAVSARSLPHRVWAGIGAAFGRVDAWRSGRTAARLLAEPERLVGTFRVGTASSGVLQPWLVGELVEILGAGVVRGAVAIARREDPREGADAYYDAIEAEAYLASGDEEEAIEAGRAALAGLAPGEAMLRARVEAIVAEAHRREGDLAAAGHAYDAAMQHDPGVFRRMEFVLPVRIESGSDELTDAVGDALERSPRFDADSGSPMRVVVEAAGGGARVCLHSPIAVVDCADAVPETAEDFDAGVQRIVDAFHAAVFAPRVDLSQADVNSLDGSNRVEREPFRGLFGGTFDEDGE